jgi:hypothetical protein
VLDRARGHRGARDLRGVGGARRDHAGDVLRQLLELRRLDEERRAELLLHAVADGAVVEGAAHHHERRAHAARRVAHRLAGREAVEPRHQKIDDRDVGRVRGERGEPGLAVAGLRDVELGAAEPGLLAEQGLEDGARQLVVVDDQDADRHRSPGYLRSGRPARARWRDDRSSGRS